ncbi:hypothetical protein L6452_31485 [Arctium lappa]|uniref:Uncharacterized protein n=1 Tax=Arctium lappa TaxID=4217 RepID=A0ACB8Z2U6_ARCLA|nr:hypothetical protein L6452_31485 [Arctium lappa]
MMFLYPKNPSISQLQLENPLSDAETQRVSRRNGDFISFIKPHLALHTTNFTTHFTYTINHSVYCSCDLKVKSIFTHGRCEKAIGGKQQGNSGADAPTISDVKNRWFDKRLTRRRCEEPWSPSMPTAIKKHDVKSIFTHGRCEKAIGGKQQGNSGADAPTISDVKNRWFDKRLTRRRCEEPWSPSMPTAIKKHDVKSIFTHGRCEKAIGGKQQGNSGADAPTISDVKNRWFDKRLTRRRCEEPWSPSMPTAIKKHDSISLPRD